MNKTLLRILIPSIVFSFGLIVVWATIKTSAPSSTPTSTTPSTSTTPDQSSGTDSLVTGDDAETEGHQTAAGPSIGATDDSAGETDDTTLAAGEIGLRGWRFRAVEPQEYAPLGDLDDPDGPAGVFLEFSPYGVGVEQMTLRDYYKTTDRDPENRYTLIKEAPERRPPFGLRRLLVRTDAGGREQFIDAIDERATGLLYFWRQIGPGIFEAEVVNGTDEVMLTVRRSYTLGPASGQITLRQSVENHSGADLLVRFETWGPGDLPYQPGGYGDFRRVHFGYTMPTDPTVVLATNGDFHPMRRAALTDAWKRDKKFADPSTTNEERAAMGSPGRLWPNEESIPDSLGLGWVATTNRYFGVAVYLAPEQVTETSVKTLTNIDEVHLYVAANARRLSDISKKTIGENFANLKLRGTEIPLAQGATVNNDFGIYTGPLSKPILTNQQPYGLLNLRSTVFYQLGCALCTFQWLASFLMQFLRLIEGDLLGFGIGDWALSIIILVICVRTLLHPITKRGQINMQRQGKKMSVLQPELKKLQEKYKDNPKKYQQEQVKLMREHQVNPAGCAFGMLPMFLQMPIWVALYAMLYFAIELRQQPGFYGVFQMFGGWEFLSDLSAPDGMIQFWGNFSIPFIRSNITSINVLPLFMGVVFYLQQKYMSPPPSPTMTPEQQSQQKIMKVMMVVMFPLFLYNAPSGLTLYILTSSIIGTLESKYIRSHIDAMDLEASVKSDVAARKNVPNRASGKDGGKGGGKGGGSMGSGGRRSKKR